MKTPQQELQELRNRPYKQADKTHLMARILQRMLNGNKHWWFAYEFSDIHYKASARLSDLYTHYPKLIEAEEIGQFKVYRLKTKKLPKWAL
jgi:hypothetical protein